MRLHPRLADNCRGFLADACIEMSGPGEEMECLEVRRINYYYSSDSFDIGVRK